MKINEFGALENMDIREIWGSEPQDFTPWLADNLERMGDAIGIELELIETEMAVGRYRADIVASDPSDGMRVLIENQLEEADLRHLGQVLAYLAGLEAKVVVWVASSFREELLAAIRWLNHHTPQSIAFFAVQVRVVRIGDSLPVPVFDVLERPNEWERAVQSKADKENGNEFKHVRREFWQHYNERRQDDDKIREGAWGRVHWSAADDMEVLVSITQRHVAAYVEIPDLQDDDAIERMESSLDTISEILVDDEVRLRQYRNQWCKTILKIDTSDRDNWDQMVDWMEERRKVYLEVLGEAEDEEDEE